MEQPGIAKFTRLLPLSIRKEGAGVGLFHHQHNSGPGGGTTTSGTENRGFFQQQNDAAGMAFASEVFNDPFETIRGSSSSSPASSSRSGSELKELVRVTVTYPSPSVGSMNPHKEISFRITNDENPMFFYHLRITESDYPMIKTQQGLLVDFYGFPNQLITLLEKCDPSISSPEADEGRSGVGCGPKFIMVLKVGMNSVLDFVESNPFKYLCHLSLQINPGTDSEVKKYLADVTSGLKKDCNLLNEKYNHLSTSMEAEIKRLKSMIDQKNEELREMREEIHTQANSLSSKHFHDMTVEKEKLLKLQSELASKFESERGDVDRRHSQVVTSLEGRISNLENENRDLLQNKFKNETVIQSYSVKIKNLEDDLKLLQQEATLTKKKNEKLDYDYHEKQRLVGSLQNRLTNLEGDLREKQNTLQRQQDMLTQFSEQKKFLEDHATSLIKEVDKLKGVNKSVSSELIKANEIIRKLQDDIRSLHAKTKLQNQITLEQERRITDYEKQANLHDETVSGMKTLIAALEEKEKRAKAELEEAEAKVETLESTIKSNENMISWLNKQLNEFQGLGNLNRFRQNLASSSAGPSALTGSLQARLGLQQDTSALGRLNNSTAAVNGSIRPGGGLFSSNIQNTLPNGTPSWMNIYQSTSTPLDNDLSSRFERISASNNNYSLGRSRLDPISEKIRDAQCTDKHNLESEKQDAENRNPNPVITASKKPGPSVSTKTAKPPTWAKPRTGKVTLESSGPGKSNPIWRNN